MLRGIPVSPGIAIGTAVIKQDTELKITDHHIENQDLEIKRLSDSIHKCGCEIDEIYEHTSKTMGIEEAQIFKAHKMILDDPELVEQVRNKISNEKLNAEYAVKSVTDGYIKIFNAMEDEYMKERGADIKDVANRLLRTLMGVKSFDLSNIAKESIVIADDLTPSDTACICKDSVNGFLTEIGGRTSHTAIMARTLEIPAIVGVDDILSNIQTGDKIVFDGTSGEIYVNPDKDILEKFEKKLEEYNQFKSRLEKMIGQESITLDGKKIELSANIGTPDDLEVVVKHDAEGIGLYRSEFLYMDNSSLPTEDEQYDAYKKVAIGMNGKPVIIRTLDIGGDKELSYLSFDEEMNPFLGYRAIRICLDRDDIFKVQLRALLRASAHGNIKIMFPMISSLEELRKAKSKLEECKSELRLEEVDFDENIDVGIMIEIPAAAILSDKFAKEVDFFSIGTNDLIQYTTAVDRMNKKVSSLYNQYHPALLRLIKLIIDNGHNEGIWVGMCGEVAGEPMLIPVLLGMGLDEFSMSPISILKARYIVNNTSIEEMKELVSQCTDMSTAKEVEEMLVSKLIFDI